MKKLIIVACCLLLLTGCEGKEREKTMILEETSPYSTDLEKSIQVSTDKIYSYEYSAYLGGSGESDKEVTVYWDKENENSLILSMFDSETDTLFIRSSDYRYGFFKEYGEEVISEECLPILLSPDGHYLLVEQRTKDIRRLVVKEVTTGSEEEIVSVPLEYFPVEEYHIEAVWKEDSKEVILGWEVSSNQESTVTPSSDPILTEPEMIKVNMMYLHNVGKKETLKFEYEEKAFSGNVYENYELKVNGKGDILRYTPGSYSCSYIQFIEDQPRITTLPITGYVNMDYWITDDGIYTQGNQGDLFYIELYGEKESSWRILIPAGEKRIIDLQVSSDGETLFIAEESEKDWYKEDSYNYTKADIYAYSLTHKRKDYLYKGAIGLVTISLNKEENKLLAGLRKNYNPSDYNTEILIFNFKP